MSLENYAWIDQINSWPWPSIWAWSPVSVEHAFELELELIGSVEHFREALLRSRQYQRCLDTKSAALV